jgi:predicted nucleic acid-binding Zn ribbon protein
MRKSNTLKLGEVIRECLRDLHIERKLKEVGLIRQWESLMGKTVALRTDKIYIRNRVLYIQVTSSVLKNELLMMRQDILARLNENAGEKLIDQIIIR